MEPDLLQIASTLGVGGAIAGLIFYFYRKDALLHADFWRGQSEMLINVVTANTAAITRMIVVVDALHRRLDRSDVGDG
jgi:hypothetical protein